MTDFKDKYKEKFNQELGSKAIAFESTLQVLEEMGYRYVKDLGIGNFGKVVDMIHPNTKKSIAVKIVNEKDLSDGEMNVWPNLCHRNILPLLGFNYIAPTHTFIFMTDKRPASLDQKLGEAQYIFDPKAFDRAVMWIRDILRGISHLHEKKFSHMDIKTNNVLISADDRSLLTDFGSIVSSEVPTSQYVSPIPYRPPETYAADGS